MPHSFRTAPDVATETRSNRKCWGAVLVDGRPGCYWNCSRGRSADEL